jgi:hypothetical protein
MTESKDNIEHHQNVDVNRLLFITTYIYPLSICRRKSLVHIYTNRKINVKQRTKKYNVKINLQRCSFIEKRNFLSVAVFDKCSMIFQIDISIKLLVYWAERKMYVMIWYHHHYLVRRTHLCIYTYIRSNEQMTCVHDRTYLCTM